MEFLGDSRYEALRRYHNQVCNYRKSDFSTIAKHYKNQYDEMQHERAAGNTGFIKLENHPLAESENDD